MYLCPCKSISSYHRIFPDSRTGSIDASTAKTQSQHELEESDGRFIYEIICVVTTQTIHRQCMVIGVHTYIVYVLYN